MRYLIYYKKSKKIAKEVITKRLHRNPIIVSDEDFASLANGKNSTSQKKVLIYDILGTSIYAMASKSVTYQTNRKKNNLGETHFTSGFLHLFEKEMNKRIRNLINKCDKVIIPDFGENKDNLEYVGPIVREIKADRATLRNTLGFTRKTVVVCTGGTDAGTYLIQRSLQAYEKLRSRFDLELIIVSGPNIRLNDSNGFRNLGFVDNLHEYIFASDLVVSLAGRSTMDESMVYGTPGIFIPIKDHFEQEQNAIKKGYKFEDIFRLETLIEEKLGSIRQRSFQKSNGAEMTARIITDML
jgi:UDP-N-acetylglucosamine--N-acetylmuramyl-(pentapeptide) pyrophosphoryl-undecaprenol N-acetylglucosamine transferase